MIARRLVASYPCWMKKFSVAARMRILVALRPSLRCGADVAVRILSAGKGLPASIIEGHGLIS